MHNRKKRSIISDATRILDEYNIDVEMEEVTPAVIVGGARYVEAVVSCR